MKALLLATFLPFSAWAQNCGPTESLHQHLSTQFGETLHSQAVAAGGQWVEMWVNEETGSWSFIVTLPDGNSCLVATGDQFEAIPQGQDA